MAMIASKIFLPQIRQLRNNKLLQQTVSTLPTCLQSVQSVGDIKLSEQPFSSYHNNVQR